MCRFLISRNVDVNTPDHDGWTALHNAASRGSLDVARLLVDAGAQIDSPSKHRYSALMNAASKGQVPLVNFLVKRGADPLARNAYGETAYDLAAAVFEVHICGVLAAAERASLSSRGPSASGGDGSAPAFNPLALHSTVPVVLHENQRLALPTLKKLSSLGGASKWTPKALSRNDRRAAYSMPLSALGVALEGVSDGEHGDDELPCFRSEVRLPVVGAETTLGLPERREIRSGGRVRVPAAAPDAAASSPSTPKAIRPRPTSRRTDSSAASSLTAVLAASPSLSPDPALSSSPSSAPRAEPAWIWASEWVIDYTAPASSASDGWSYAASFAAPPDEWSPSPPAEVARALEGGPAALAALATGGGPAGGRKFVRRRRWVRLMRRRLDLPDFGYGGAPSSASAQAHERGEGGEREQEDEMRGMDYRARARFLAGAARPRSSDAASVRSGKSVDEPLDAGEEEDRAELRKLAARLERAADELRRGMGEDEDEERKRAAQDELEAFVHELALVRARIGAADEEDSAGASHPLSFPSPTQLMPRHRSQTRTTSSSTPARTPTTTLVPSGRRLARPASRRAPPPRPTTSPSPSRPRRTPRSAPSSRPRSRPSSASRRTSRPRARASTSGRTSSPGRFARGGSPTRRRASAAAARSASASSRASTTAAGAASSCARRARSTSTRSTRSSLRSSRATSWRTSTSSRRRRAGTAPAATATRPCRLCRARARAAAAAARRRSSRRRRSSPPRRRSGPSRRARRPRPT